MKNNGKKYTRSYFAGKLDDYLSARHPAVTGRGRMIKLRSGIAAGLFRQALLTGSDTPRALEAADAALYSGLIFSPFDMVWTVIETEFPEIPASRSRRAALTLLPWCAEEFSRYKTDDDFYGEPACRMLYDELCKRITYVFDTHGLQQEKTP